MRPPRTTRRKAGTTSSHHAPYDLGYTRTTMGVNKEKRTREGEQSSKTHPQFRSQAATRLREVGIASNRGSAYRGEYVPGPCTHRPSHYISRKRKIFWRTEGNPERGNPFPGEKETKVKVKNVS